MKKALGLSGSIFLAVGMASLFIAFSAQALDDTTPPALLDLDFTPKMVDVSGGGQAISFTAQLTDDLSGIYYAGVYLASPSGVQGYAPFLFDLVSGDRLSGTLQGGLWVPQFTENGDWLISDVHAQDVAGNVHYWEQNELRAMGIPVTLTVVGALRDTLPPSLLGLTFTPKVVNVSDGPQTITFTVQLTDDLSGIYQAGFYFVSPLAQVTYIDLYDLSSGDALSGTLQTVWEMPQNSPTGYWNITFLYAFDQAGNVKQWWQYELDAMGIQTTLPVGVEYYFYLPVVIRR